MKKNRSIAGARRALKKPLLIMKLTLILTICCVLQSWAHDAKGQTVTLHVQDTEIAKVLSTIEKQGNFRFLYNSRLKDLRNKVNVSFSEAEINEVLGAIFSGTDLTYKRLENNLIAIRSEDPQEQENRITGRVTGESGEPLSGVSIVIKGTARGTTTDNNGSFTLVVPNNATLVISFIGYIDQEVAVGNKTTIDVKLAQSTRKLDEVVVIGYGTASKRDLTGSIVKIAGKEVADKPNTNPVASLQGKVAGLSVVNNGTPGQAPDIRIRGTVSIGNVSPLYVVDGILNDNIDYINPNDIESIEVLKDPSSLAIFGVRGASGVIAITTKRARAGQTIVNFNTSYGFKKLVDKIKLADAETFKLLFAEERANNGTTEPFDYSGLTANTDWIDAVTRTGQFSSNNLSVSGSTDKNRFNFGIGYMVDEGIIKHEKLQRATISFADELKVSRNIKLGITFNGSRQENPYNATSVLDDARKVIPQVSAGTQRFFVKNPYGTDSSFQDLYSGLDVGLQNSGVVNPLLRVENEWNKFISTEYRIVGSIYAEVSFLKYFNFRSTFYGDMSTVNARQYVPLYYSYNPKNNQPELYSQLTTINENDQTYRKWQQDHVLNFKTNIGDHGLTVTGGFTTYYFGNFGRNGNAQQVPGIPIPNDERFWYISNYFNKPGAVATSNQREYTTVSVLARALYNYKNKYFLNASFRDDASSRIPETNRHQQFWAVGAAWDMSREDFMDQQNIFNALKIKGSVGVLGNQTASQLDGTPLDYPFYPGLSTGTAAVFGSNIYTAADRLYIPNPDLKWETVLAYEAGVEGSALNNRLTFEANYFNRTTRDLMTYINNATVGIKDQLVNGGSIRNSGIEVSAGYTHNITQDLILNVSGNITFLDNEVIKLADQLPTGVLIRGFQNNGSAESRTKPGLPIASFWGYVVEGLYQTNADIAKSPDASSLGTVRPGDFKFKDVNGDGKITADDRTVIGNPTPDFTYGGSINLSYKGISLGIDVVGVYGNEIFRTWGSLESPFQRVNYSGDKIDRWHGPGTSNWVPIISQARRYNYNGSTYNIEDGSYFRFRNIQLGYNFPQKLISRVKVKGLRVYANVQNLKTFKNNYGYTAEYGGGATAFGYDNAGGAIPVVTTAGLNITF
jgi:TonB-linked SusC/RagA family outer membrane protein